MSYSRGDVLIALFPNADGSPPKPRPVVVVQSDVYNATVTVEQVNVTIQWICRTHSTPKRYLTGKRRLSNRKEGT